MRVLSRGAAREERPGLSAIPHTVLTASSVAIIQTKQIWALAFSHDSRNLAIATGTNSVQVFDTSTWSRRLTLRQRLLAGAAVFTVAFSPSGGKVVTGGSVLDGGLAQTWFSDTGRRGIKISVSATVWAVAFSPDGRWLVTGDEDGNVCVWKDVGRAKLLMKLSHTDRVQGISFSPDRKQFATVSPDRTARIWDAYTGELRQTLRHDRIVWAAAFSPDSRLLATGSGYARVWDAYTGVELLVLPSHSEPPQQLCRSVAFSADSCFLAAADMGRTARIWDVRSGAEVLQLHHEHEIRAIAFSPDRRWLVTGDGESTDSGLSGRGVIQVWRLQESRRVGPV
jgi:WD40 repeat protein